MCGTEALYASENFSAKAGAHKIAHAARKRSLQNSAQKTLHRQEDAREDEQIDGETAQTFFPQQALHPPQAGKAAEGGARRADGKALPGHARRDQIGRASCRERV